MKRILLILILALAAYELFALLDKENGDTISEVVWKESQKRPLLPFALGFLMGHFFWQRERT